MNRFYLLPLVLVAFTSSIAFSDDRPNILWITSEDNGPHLGCYGDDFADSPNIDSIATKGMIYLNAWSTAPVCAPARTTLISGLYPPCTGAEHMRSLTRLPAGFKMYPQYLREAGYYCTNNSKEDYNLEKKGEVWNDSSGTAHWKNRKPGQPFFAIFNHTISHESKLRTRPHTQVHDPAKVRVPAYHPDTPEVRQDWAQYYDKITEMDELVGENLRELAEAGLAEETIVFYYGDHGSGMPRSKRWPYNSGLQVPLIVHVPEKFRHLAPSDYSVGGSSDRLVGFIDLPATLLSLVGVKPPDHFQGFACMGEYAEPEQPFIYGFRGRMDERYDMVRSVRDKRYIYIRNYMPHKIYGQFIEYMFRTPTTQVWHDLYQAGKLSPPQTYFWETKPAEELYDLESDRDEVNNLVNSPEHQQVLKQLRKAQRELALRIRDVGFLPEDEIHQSQELTPYDIGHDDAAYPLERIIPVAELASSLEKNADEKLVAYLSDDLSTIRYWAAMGLLMRGPESIKPNRKALRGALNDVSPSVQIISAQALGQYGNKRDAAAAGKLLVEKADVERNGLYLSMLALNALDAMDERAEPFKSQIEALPTQADTVPSRLGAYVGNLKAKTLSDLE